MARIAASEKRWRLELADPIEALEVLGAVERWRPCLVGGAQEPLAGVVPDGVDGQPGRLGQLVDPPAGLAHRLPFVAGPTGMA